MKPTRIKQYLAHITGNSDGSDKLPLPVSRIEQYINQMCESGATQTQNIDDLSKRLGTAETALGELKTSIDNLNTQVEAVKKAFDEFASVKADTDYLLICNNFDYIGADGEIDDIEMVKNYYDNGLWSKDRIYDLTKKEYITAEQYEKILGEAYIPPQ